MATTNSEDVLTFSVAVDIRDSLKAITTFQKEMLDAMKAIAHSTDAMGKVSEKASRKAADAAQGHTEAVEGVTDALRREGEQLDDVSDLVKELSKRAAKAHGEEKAAIEENIRLLQKAEKERRKSSGGSSSKGGGRNPIRSALLRVSKDLKDDNSTLRKAGELLKAPLESFLRRDLKGVLADSFKIAGKMVSKGNSFAAMGFSNKSRQFGLKGRHLSEMGKERGGLAGGVMQMGGAGLKGLSKVLGGLGKSLAFFSKIGPIFSMLGGALVGLVKLFIDADAMVKEFNAGILQSASSMEFLSDAGGSVGASMRNMEDTLDGIRDAAHDAKFNLDWGITKEQHTQVLNVLTQEGVALGYLSRQAGGTREGMEDLSKSLVATGVAYSRALGQPIEQVMQLQAQMITEMGAGVKQTELAFASMARAAGESGIASNKFFSMIQGVSQDLSVWNMRMEDSVDLLGKLGKVMSPQSAQKFFQMTTQGFRQMGRQDLLKQSMFAGAGTTRKANQGTISRMEKELAATLGVSEDQIRGADHDSLYKMIQGVDKSQRGTLNQKINDLTTVRQGAKGGTYSQAQALRHTDTAGQMAVVRGVLTSMGGSLDDPNSLNVGAVADATGYDAETVETLANIYRTAKAQRKLLLDQATTDEERQKIMAKSDDEMINEIGKSMMPQSAEEVQKGILEQGQKQGQLTQSLESKLGALVDWFMNTFYNLMLDIWDTISSFGFGSSNKEKSAIYRSKDQGLIAALDASLAKNKGDFSFGDFQASLASGAMGQSLAKAVKTAEGQKKVSDAVGQTMSVDSLLKMVRMNPDLVKGGKSDALNKTISHRGVRTRGGPYDAQALMKEAGFSPEDIEKTLSKALWAMDDVSAITDFNKIAGLKADGAPAQTTARVTAQAAKSEASAQAEEANTQLSQISAASTTQAETLKQGITLDKGFVEGDLSKSTGDAMLSALRTALYEYYLYSGTDRQTVARAFGPGGANASSLGRMRANSSGPGGPGGILTAMASEAPANASGGVVTGISNGMAVVASHGEGLASVGKGERIVPAGGGGTSVTVNVNGIGGKDLADFVRAGAVDAIRQWKRKERLD